MKIVIAGCGKIGTSIISYLCNEKHSLTVIDKDPEIINNVLNYYDVGGIVGNITYVSTMMEANVQKCNIFISVTDNDELNLVSCRIAKALGANKTIARVNDTEYTDQSELLKKCFDIDMVINPELATAKEILNLLRFPFATKVSSFEKGRAVGVEFKVPINSAISNKTVKDIMIEFGGKCIIAGVLKNNDEIIIPNGDTIIEDNDIINLISTPSNIYEFVNKIGILTEKIKSVFIIGGSRISFHLARMLSKEGVAVKIIEKRESRCRHLMEGLDNSVEIIMADGTNEQILSEERLPDYDACVSLTNLDEENIISSLYARSHGIGTIITKLNNDRLNDILTNLNLPKKISPKKIAVNNIIFFTRVFRAKEENTIERLRKSLNDKMEVLEFSVNNNPDFTGKCIKDLNLKSSIILASIIRQSTAIVPSGNEVIEGNDKIIISTKTNIKSLDKILK